MRDYFQNLGRRLLLYPTGLAPTPHRLQTAREPEIYTAFYLWWCSDHCTHSEQWQSSTGPDGIVAEVLKHGGDELVECLILIYNCCRSERATPEQWSQVIKLIYKSGASTSLDNYRDISLTSVVGKVFTATLDRRMTSSDQEVPWLPYMQATSGREVGRHFWREYFARKL